jgi:DNA polymerase III epsilon subunit-like protein
VYSDHILSGFNIISFDILAIEKDMHKKGINMPRPSHILDVRSVWKKTEGTQKGKLTEVAAKYGVVQENAHRALGDVIMTAGILDAMLEKHGCNHVHEHAIMTGTCNTGNTGNTGPCKSDSEMVKGSKGFLKSVLIRVCKDGTVGTVLDRKKVALEAGCTMASVTYMLRDLVEDGSIASSHLKIV